MRKNLRKIKTRKRVCISIFTFLCLASLFASNVCARELTRLGKGWIQDLAFSPDGTQFAVATTVGIWIYDSRTGRELRVFGGHMGGAHAVSYSQDGEYLAAAHQDMTIRIWQPREDQHGTRVPTLRGHKAAIHALTFSHDVTKPLLASASSDNTIRLWDPHASVDEEKLIAILPYRDAVRNVAFSPDSRLLAGGSDDGIVQVWDAGTVDVVYTFRDHTDSVQAVHFSQNRTELVSASLDGTAILWSLVGEGGRLHDPIQHDVPVYAAKFSPDGDMFATGGADKLIRLWNTETGEQRFTFKGHTDSVSHFDFSPNGNALVSGSADGNVLLWDVIGSRTRINISGHTGGIKALAYTEDNRIRTCGMGLDDKPRLWDAGTGSVLSTVRGHKGLVTAAAFSADGKTLVTAGNDTDAIFVWDVLELLAADTLFQESMLLNVLSGNAHGITALALSPAGTTLASGGTDGRIHLLDMKTRRELKILKGAQGTITALAFVVDGTHLFSGEEDGTIRYWDALTGMEVRTVYRTPLGAITALAYASDTGYLAIGDATGTIQFFDLFEQEKKEKSFFVPHAKITVLFFSEGGTQLVSGSENGIVFVWDMDEVFREPSPPIEMKDDDVASQRVTTPQTDGSSELTTEQIAQTGLNSTVHIGTDKGTGSGFFVAPGYIATNYHVIENAREVHVKLVGTDGEYIRTSVAATDEAHDLAVLKVTGIDAPALPLANSDSVQIGAEIYAIGNPHNYKGTVSDGIVSSIRVGDNSRWIQITAPISPGSSGGAVLNSRGEVIGIATLIFHTETSQNINFAVPANYVKALLRQVR